ncbi:MAG TPA: hypothetical protein VGM37_02315 [Armatimonadota bacterium]
MHNYMKPQGAAEATLPRPRTAVRPPARLGWVSRLARLAARTTTEAPAEHWLVNERNFAALALGAMAAQMRGDR